MEVCGNTECVDYDNKREDNHCRVYYKLSDCDRKGLQVPKPKIEKAYIQRPCTNLSCIQFDVNDKYHCECFTGTELNVCADYTTSQKPKKETKPMNEFDNALSQAKAGSLTTKIENLTESAKATATRSKNTVVRVKVGRIAIAAIKSALRKTPGIPVYAKMLLDSEYADIVIGAVVPIVVPMITTNKKAIRLSEDVNIAGGVAIADQLVFIDNLVAQVMDKVYKTVSPEDMVDNGPEAKL